MEKIHWKTFKVNYEHEIEYVQILDKINDKYLVVVVGEPANVYKNNKRYKSEYTGDDRSEREIITPNMGKTFIMSPSTILEMVNG